MRSTPPLVLAATPMLFHFGNGAMPPLLGRQVATEAESGAAVPSGRRRYRAATEPARRPATLQSLLFDPISHTAATVIIARLTMIPVALLVAGFAGRRGHFLLLVAALVALPIGTLVAVFPSNDTTAIVLASAVISVARAAKASSLIPCLPTCAFVANAAPFVLPISNHVHLVVFSSEMPPLGERLARFALPSALAVASTFRLLRWTQRRDGLQDRLNKAPTTGAFLSSIELAFDTDLTNGLPLGLAARRLHPGGRSAAKGRRRRSRRDRPPPETLGHGLARHQPPADGAVPGRHRLRGVALFGTRPRRDAPGAGAGSPGGAVPALGPEAEGQGRGRPASCRRAARLRSRIAFERTQSRRYWVGKFTERKVRRSS